MSFSLITSFVTSGSSIVPVLDRGVFPTAEAAWASDRYGLKSPVGVAQRNGLGGVVKILLNPLCTAETTEVATVVPAGDDSVAVTATNRCGKKITGLTEITGRSRRTVCDDHYGTVRLTLDELQWLLPAPAEQTNVSAAKARHADGTLRLTVEHLSALVQNALNPTKAPMANC